MTELETALRTMLHERGGDIAVLPPHLAELRRPEPSRLPARRTVLLIAATVAAVLAVVGSVIAVRSGAEHHSVPPATHTPAPSHVNTTPPPTLPPSHAARDVELAWFGMQHLSGWTQHMRESVPGYRWLAVRKDTDRGTPIGCNGCESASDYIYVFDRGRFDPAKYGVTSWHQVTVSGRRGYVGTMPWYTAQHYRVPTVAWQYRPGSWALVQGVTTAGGSDLSLQNVADAVQPGVAVPITLPFTLRGVPELPITDVTDDRSEGYSFDMTFGDAAGRTFTITLWPGSSYDGRFDVNNAQARDIGGLPGYLGSGQAAVAYRNGLLVLGFSEPTPAPDAAGRRTAAQAAAQDELELLQLVSDLRWTAEPVPAEQAIP